MPYRNYKSVMLWLLLLLKGSFDCVEAFTPSQNRFTSTTIQAAVPLPRPSPFTPMKTSFSSNEESILTETSSTTSPSRVSTIVASLNASLTFPSYNQLMQCNTGEYVTSDSFTVTNPTNNQSYEFCVKLFPRGGGHKTMYDILGSTNKDTGDDAVRASLQGVANMFAGKSNPLRERVGVYLQYLPKEQNDPFVDATFALRLCGRQVAPQPRFDVEWRAGMRFVPLEASKLSEGQANDFGAHLLQTILLDDFLGVTEKDYTDPNFDRPIECQVKVYLHNQPNVTSVSVFSNELQTRTTDQSGISRGLQALNIADLRTTTTNGKEPLRVGQIVVPVLRQLSERPDMFRWGAYPGVEYRILRMIDTHTEEDVFFHQPERDLAYEIKPIYPLVQQLERPWPAKVPEKQIPKLISSSQYNAISAVGSLLTAVMGLTMAFVISQMTSVFFIPSRSMEPTLDVGDVLLVEKVSPRLFPNSVRGGQVVLFHPPSALQEIVSRSGGRVTDRDLFVKRVVAAQPGDMLSVSRSGDVKINGDVPAVRRDLCTAEPLRLIERFITAGDKTLPPSQVFVLGDCASVSVDSRVWGSLEKSNIVGRPLMRIWPLSRFGAIQDLPTTESTLWSD